MAQPSLANIYGAELANLITANIAAIATDLGVSQSVVSNPEAFLAVIVEKAAAWLSTDGENDCGMSIGDQSKTLGFGSHDGDVGFQRSVTFWQPSQDTGLNFASIE